MYEYMKKQTITKNKRKSGKTIKKYIHIYITYNKVLNK